MEKLFIGLTLLICSLQQLHAQDSLCVFSAKGSVYFQTPGSMKQVHKGDYIVNTGRINLGEQSTLVTIDQDGGLYYITQPGNHHFNHLNAFKRDQSSLTTRYLAYAWNELMAKTKQKTVIAGVFRGNIYMQFPRDSAAIASSTLHFRWNRLSPDVPMYFFLKNKTTQEIVKLASNGSSLALYPELGIFQTGNEFEWTVSEQEFPTHKNLVFYQFTRISPEEFREQRTKFNPLISDLKQLNFSNTEINKILCESYGLCN